MNTRYLLIMLIFLAACNHNNHKSDAYGNFEAVETIVSSQASGQILQLYINEGDVIKSGQIVGLIDTTSLHLQKQQFISKKSAIVSSISNVNSQIAVQKQQKKNLLVDQQRIINLFEEGAATKKQLDDINGAMELLEKQIDATKTQLQAITDEISATEAQIKLLDENINNARIENPVEGTVLTKMAEKGEITAFGKPLYKIANLDELILKAYVSGDQLSQIKTGQTVEVLIDKNKKEYKQLKGTLSWISEEAEFTPKIIQTKKERVNLVYAIKVRVKNNGELKIGMPGEINFKNINQK